MPKSEEKTQLVVTAGEAPKRLDVFLTNRDPYLSRAALQRLIHSGKIRINGLTVRPSQKIKPGDHITLEIPRPEPLELAPEPIPIEIVYEDDALVVVNKPAGLVVHPAPGHWSGTLVNALLHHFNSCDVELPSIGGKERPGLVHRLDKETSGIMVVAKTDQAHRTLAAQFKQHTISRQYEAFVLGCVRKSESVIELAIGRDIRERKKFSSHTRRARASTTAYQVVERFGRLATWVRVFPRTGRTHQIRVHFAWIKHPLLGDPAYGGRSVKELGGLMIPRVMLHAQTLGFRHPTESRYVEFTAPLPFDMESVRTALAHGTRR